VRRGPKSPPRLTAEGVRKAALRYLGQRSASRAQLRRVLLRRVDRSLAIHGGDRDELVGWVEQTLRWCERLGYLDDARYARDKARSLRRRGASARKVRAKLAEKGIDTPLVDVALAQAPGELVGALRLLRRRRFGPWSRGEEDRRRVLAALGRAGFGYDVARRALEMEREEAERLLSE